MWEAVYLVLPLECIVFWHFLDVFCLHSLEKTKIPDFTQKKFHFSYCTGHAKGNDKASKGFLVLVVIKIDCAI